MNGPVQTGISVHPDGGEPVLHLIPEFFWRIGVFARSIRFSTVVTRLTAHASCLDF
jgi:hypothetical protein